MLNRTLTAIITILALSFVGCGGEGITDEYNRELYAGKSCDQLNEKQCQKRSDCMLDQLACPAICEDDGNGGCLPCDAVATCRAKTPPAPPACEELNEKQCQKRSDCMMDQAICPAICELDGNGGCLPCDAVATCRPKTPPAPPACEELDEKQCQAREDCMMDQAVCPAICMDDGNGGCLPCDPVVSCRTKTPPTCEELNEEQCQARSDCVLEQAACPAICMDDGNGGCLPCDPLTICRSNGVDGSGTTPPASGSTPGSTPSSPAS